MKLYLDCIPCFFDQAIRAGRIAGADEETIKQLLDEIGAMLKDISMDTMSPEVGRRIYGKIREVTGNGDPYKEVKIKSTEQALALYDHLKTEIRQSHDPLLTAVRIAVAGNVIDYGIARRFDMEQEIHDVMRKDFAIFDYDEFRRHLERARDVLYIGDNTGEHVLDRLLIEEMGKLTVFVVREVPVINDVTYDDAVRGGLDKAATILSSGSDAPGNILKFCSTAFLDVYAHSGFIISKGQGNYEGLSEENKTIFFMLKAKCKVIAEDIGIKEGDVILKGINT
ncbi:MAG: ARMT1-like domain-containing protein [Planctomycetota bacterium]